MKELLELIKASPENTNGDVHLRDIKPFDESTLGRDTGYYGQQSQSGEWVPATLTPKPVNCSFDPSVDNPDQTIEEAGLVEGAEIAVIDLCCFMD